MSKLAGLFGKFKTDDLSYDVYKTYMHHYKFKGLDCVFAVTKFFENLKKVDKEKKELIDGPVDLPIAMFLDIIYASRIVGQKYLEQKNLRELMKHAFVIFDEDKVEVSMGLGADVFYNETGLFKDLKISMQIIIDKKYTPGTLAVLKIKLLSPSPLREEEEKKCLFGNYEKALEIVSGKEVHQKVLNSLPEELKAKRLEIYKVSSVEDVPNTDFGSKDLLVILKILDQMKNPYFSNERVLSEEALADKESLEKMKDWLTRSLGN